MAKRPLRTAGQIHAEQKNWDKYERKLYARERKNRQGRKALRLRPLKNFLFFFAGLLFSFVLIFGSIALGVFVIPTGTYLNIFGVSEDKATEYIDEDFVDKSLFKVVMGLTEVRSINDINSAVPFVKSKLDGLLDSLNPYVSLNREALYSASFSNIANYENYDIKIVATLDSLGVGSMLGSLTEMSLFNSDEKVLLNDGETQATVGDIQAQSLIDGNDVNYKLYTYKKDGEYVTAANEDNSFWSESVLTTTPLYYASFLTTPISDLLDIALDRVKVLPVVDIMGVFTTVEEDSLIAKILGKTTVSGIGSLDVNSLGLSNFLTRYENDGVTETQLYKLLRETLSVPTSEDITISDLSGDFNLDVLKLSSVMDTGSMDQMLKDILSDTTEKDFEEITIGDLSNMGSPNLDSILLSQFIQRYENDGVTETQMYKILRSVFNVDPANDIKIGDLSGEIDIDGIKLSVVMDADSMDSGLQGILCDVTEKDYDEITVGDMTNIDIGKVVLSNVLDELDVGHYTGYETGSPEYNQAKAEYENNKKLWDLIRSAITPTDPDVIRVNDLMTGFTVDNIKLSSVIENNDNTKSLVDVMSDVTGKQYEDIKISDVSSFDISKVKLSTVLVKKQSGDVGYEDNKKLWDLLNEAVTPSEGTEILLSDLSDGFSLSNVSLKTVLGETSDNVFLSALLSDDDVTVGNMTEKMNAIKISDVFTAECFTTDSSKAVEFSVGTYTYKKVGDDYVLSDTAGEDGNLYYVSSESGIWMLMYYNAENPDADGFATQYTATNMTLGDMQEKIDSISGTMTNATIRQLVMCGIFDANDNYEDNTITYIYAKMLSESIGS